MQYLCENLVYEKQNDYYLAYVLKDNSFFYNTVYQILKNNNDKCFIKPYKVNYNGAVKFIFSTENLKEIEKHIKRIKLNEAMKTIENILEKIIEIGKAGFIKKETIDISDNHIFVDADGKIQFVCVPVSVISTIDTQRFFDEMLKRKLAELIMSTGNTENTLIARFFQDCNDDNISIHDIYSSLKENKYGTYNLEKNHNDRLEEIFGYYTLESADITRTNIIISKKKAILGKSHKESDYVISESFISRQHCELVYSDNQIYIMDLGSTNGTYVNGERIPANVYIPVAIGDNISLSSVSYIVTGGYRV